MTVLRSSTPEQRWNSALAVAFSLVLLVFGRPGATGSSAADGSLGRLPSDAPSTLPSPAHPSATALVAQPPGLPALTLPLPTVVPETTPLPETSLHVTALVMQAADGSSADKLVAQRFLPDATFVDATSANICRELPADTDLVVVAHDLTPSAWQCLTTNRLPALTFDSRGSVGALLSMRRGLATSIVDQAGLLTGRIGIVAQSTASSEVAAATKTLAAHGHTVVATAFLDSSAEPDTAGVLKGVLSFTAARVDTVLFAVSVADQSLWVDVSPVRSTYVVADAADAITNEGYPGAFDGSRSRTTQTGSWFARVHGSSATQRWCRHELAGTSLSTSDAVTAMRWCALGRAASLLGSPRRPALPLATRMRLLNLESPVTSEVGPHGDGWGPADLATTVWRADCSCWAELAAFETRNR